MNEHRTGRDSCIYCEHCLHFDGFDQVRSTLVNCDLYGEISINDIDDFCFSFKKAGVVIESE